MSITYNTDIFLKEDSISYYLLGIFITDGNIFLSKKSGSASIELKSIHFDFLSKIRDLICKDRKITKSHNSCFRLRIHNNIIGKWLIENQCVPNKTKIVKFPNVPIEYLPDFVRGLIDGDGSLGIYSNRAMIRFDSASFNFIKSLVDVLLTWNIKVKVIKTKWIECVIDGRVVKSTTQMYRLSLSGLSSYKLVNIIYYPGCFGLDLKKEKANEIIHLIEANNVLSKTNLIKLERLSSSKIIWPSDDELVSLIINHNGLFKSVAKLIGVSSWGLSCRLKSIGKYNYIRSIFPI